MIELFITSENFFSVYLKDLNVPIAYIILSIFVLLICKKKNQPLLRTLFIWVFSVAGLASVLDAVYDYQIKIFVYHNMSLGEGLLFLLFPVPFYALCFFIWKYGELKKTLIIIFPIIYEILTVTANLTILPNVIFTPIIRYFYVMMFIEIVYSLKKVPKKGTSNSI